MIAEIRIPAHLVEILHQGVRITASGERAVFALASHTTRQDGVILTIRRILPLPDDAYQNSTAHGASWQGRAMLPVLNEALQGNLGVLVFHSHPWPGQVSLSSDDRSSAGTLLPAFQNVIPSRPHGSVVLGTEYCGGQILLPRGRIVERVRVRLLGTHILDMHDRMLKVRMPKTTDIHHRQILLIKGEGQAILRRSKVAVIGLGGGGGHVVQQLAHMGVGTIIGIDHDRASSTNRSRMIGLTASDVRRKRHKTTIMARLVRSINAEIQFIPVPYQVPAQQTIDAIKESDIVVGCLDTFHAREELQSLAWRYLIPYVDIGLLIQGPPEARKLEIGGNIGTFIPGRFCQWCIGFLTQAKLDAETDGRPKSYLRGARTQAQVVSFNGLLASQAASEVLQLLTGFQPYDDPDMTIKKFDGLAGTLEQWVVKKNEHCQLCRTTLGAGELTWHKN